MMRTATLAVCAAMAFFAPALLTTSSANEMRPALAGPQCQPLEAKTQTTGIPGFTMAEAQSYLRPNYPRQSLDYWSEGWALIELAVTRDGAVRDLSLVDAIGHKDFVNASLQAVRHWRFKPATLNGKPVDQFLSQTSVLYLMSPTETWSHDHFVRRYNQARRLLDENKIDDAIRTLEVALTRRLTLKEEAAASFLLAAAYSRKTDWARALFHARHALLDGGSFLDTQLRAPAFALLVDLEIRDGNMIEAKCAFEALRAHDSAAAGPQTAVAKLAAQIEAALNDPSPLALGTRLSAHPLSDGPAVWRHTLSRSKFSFVEVKGDVTSFRLACFAAEHNAAVEMGAQWRIPANAGPCILRVEGAPGASFILVEEW